MEPVRVGLVGCGNISEIYFQNVAKLEAVEIVACADLIPERAQTKAAAHGVATACAPDELMADARVELVLNLTIPAAHAEVALAALEAGKSVYNEKPLAVTREDGKRMLERAAETGALVGGAPDTFLGGGIQTCRKLIGDHWIGRPVAATAFMMCHGHESWHPDPDFYYQIGGGPMFDMGPYYLTALVALMGPVKRVSGSTAITFPEREISSEPKRGTMIQVNTPTHVAATLDFASGAIGTVVMSFDVWGHSLPPIQIHGTTGSLNVPDPNGFGGPVQALRAGTGWTDVPLTHGYAENSRGLGVADMAVAMRTGRKARAGGDITFHVLDVMHAVHEASERGVAIELQSSCQMPEPLPMDLRPGKVDP